MKPTLYVLYSEPRNLRLEGMPCTLWCGLAPLGSSFPLGACAAGHHVLEGIPQNVHALNHWRMQRPATTMLAQCCGKYRGIGYMNFICIQAMKHLTRLILHARVTGRWFRLAAPDFGRIPNFGMYKQRSRHSVLELVVLYSISAARMTR